MSVLIKAYFLRVLHEEHKLFSSGPESVLKKSSAANCLVVFWGQTIPKDKYRFSTLHIKTGWLSFEDRQTIPNDKYRFSSLHIKTGWLFFEDRQTIPNDIDLVASTSKPVGCFLRTDKLLLYTTRIHMQTTQHKYTSSSVVQVWTFYY